MIILAIETTQIDWGTVIIQSIITLGVVFGGAGFWEYIKSKNQAKREDKKEEKNYDAKFDKLFEQFSGLSNQMSDMSDNMQELKQDLTLLQKANEETVKYRKLRDSRDQEALEVQKAVIESITGLMRDRLLDNYRRCMKKGYYSMEEREIYGKMFECYEKPPFCGNGVMHDLRPLMKALPIKPIDKSTDEDIED